jgi:non-ribosomal peptide synthetase component F
VRDLDAVSIPIGRPITETQVYICNSRGELTPQGLVGELLVGGLGVGRGYLGRPDLTAQKFIPDTLGDGAGGCIARATSSVIATTAPSNSSAASTTR